MAKIGNITAVSVDYSTDDGATWNTLYNGAIAATVTLKNAGDIVRLRAATGATNTTFATDTNVYHYFVITGRVSIFGNIMNLIS